MTLIRLHLQRDSDCADPASGAATANRLGFAVQLSAADIQRYALRQGQRAAERSFQWVASKVQVDHEWGENYGRTRRDSREARPRNCAPLTTGPVRPVRLRRPGARADELAQQTGQGGCCWPARRGRVCGRSGRILPA